VERFRPTRFSSPGGRTPTSASRAEPKSIDAPAPLSRVSATSRTGFVWLRDAPGISSRLRVMFIGSSGPSEMLLLTWRLKQTCREQLVPCLRRSRDSLEKSLCLGMTKRRARGSPIYTDLPGSAVQTPVLVSRRAEFAPTKIPSCARSRLHPRRPTGLQYRKPKHRKYGSVPKSFLSPLRGTRRRYPRNEKSNDRQLAALRSLFLQKIVGIGEAKGQSKSGPLGLKK
jgi:hypothetical protein